MDTSRLFMQQAIKEKIIQVCNEKIAKKGDQVGLSFYAFFANKNDDPETLMQVAEWWIKTHQLDHFEKASKIKQMIENG
ncbi:Msl2237 protein [Acinetobacter bereziniae]|nr:Msl2237 protein [Acinetobacter bereziniae]